MSSINWTSEQKLAIESRGGNLLVSAAAGSGKTAVLVERIVQSLLRDQKPVDIDRLLVVTFTEAAAGEMRQRVNSALAAALRDRPASNLLQRQMLLLPRAHIGTIHSFCSEVIRNHFYLLGLDPGFRVMDENEASMLRTGVMDDVLEDLYQEYQEESPETPFLYLMRGLAGGQGDETMVINLAFSLYNFAHSLPRPAAWLKNLPLSLQAAAGLSWEEQAWIEEWRAIVRLEISNWAENLEEALLLAASPGGPEKYEQVLAEDLEKVKGWLGLTDQSFVHLQAALAQGQSWPRLPVVAREETDEDIKGRVQKLRNDVKKKVKEFFKQFMSRPAEDMIKDLGLAAPAVGALVELVLSFKEKYQETKKDRGVVDFSDLEHLALAVLAANGEGAPAGETPAGDLDQDLLPSPAAGEYQRQFAEVLVDEYQDINGVQEAIIRLVSRPDNRFLVGDVKQSIYRFRLADPTVFLNCYREFNDIDSPVLKPGRRLDLQANFRSRPVILQAVNYFFRRLMDQRVAEIDYDRRARLNPGRADPSGEDGAGPVEMHLLEYDRSEIAPGLLPGAAAAGNSPGELSDSDQEELNQTQFEARWTAEYIRRLVIEEKACVYDGDNGYRPAAWRDVVVLMRSLKGRVGVFLEEFRRLGIPVYAGGSGGYFSAPEVQTMLSLLQIIDNPRRDIPLAAVLRSPVLGLDAGDLAQIRLVDRNVDFYTAVCQAAGGAAGHEAGNGLEDAGLAQKLRDFLGRLDSWRDLARRLPPADLLEELYRQTSYYDLVGAIPGGSVRQANLRALVDRARRFEGTVYRGLFRFLRFIEQVQARGGDMDTARSLGENENVVRIMSIHRSKGLEFPVVLAAGMGRNFNLMDLSRTFLWHRRLGCGPVVIDLGPGLRYPSVLHRVISHRLRLETLAEEMRLLYVAFTRARDRLVVCGTVKNLNRSLAAWAGQTSIMPAGGPLSAACLAGAKGPLDWLGPAMWLHPHLKNICHVEKPASGGGEGWRVFLWPAASLSALWQPGETPGEERPEARAGAWAENIKQLRPVPLEMLDNTAGVPGAAGVADAAELEGKLFWTYPYQGLCGLPSKLTVTEWRHRQEEMEEAAGEAVPAAGILDLDLPASPGAGAQEPSLDLPAFYTGQHFDGAERGRVLHLVMENLNLVPAPDRQDIRRQLDLLVDRDILRPQQRSLVKSYELARFLAGELGRRLLAAAREKRLWREVSFTMGLPAAEFYPDLSGTIPAGESILLQGVIDCLLAEEKGLVVIDYKTDRLAPADLDRTVKKYRPQMDLYARAAGDILGRPVTGKYLYFFALDQAVACP